MGTGTKTAKSVGMDAAKTTSKRFLQKIAEAADDSIGREKEKIKEGKKIMNQIKRQKSKYHKKSVNKLLTI